VAATPSLPSLTFWSCTCAGTLNTMLPARSPTLCCVMLNTRQWEEEFGVGGTMGCLPTTWTRQYRGAQITFQWKSRRVQEELEFKKSSNMLHYPTWGCGMSIYSDGRTEEIKKSSSSRRAQTWSTEVRHGHLPDSVRKSQLTSTRPIAVCLLANLKDLIKLLHICTCVFSIYDI